MAIARVFKSGNSQAVRLPKEFRLHVKEMEIVRQGNDLLLREPVHTLASAYDALASIGHMGLHIEIPDDPADLFKPRKDAEKALKPVRAKKKAAR